MKLIRNYIRLNLLTISNQLIYAGDHCSHISNATLKDWDEMVEHISDKKQFEQHWIRFYSSSKVLLQCD